MAPRAGTRSQLPLLPADSSVVALKIRESRRARRLSIQVCPLGRVEVVVPWHTPAAEVERFVTINRQWIDKVRREFRSRYPRDDIGPPQQVALPAVGEHVELVYAPTDSGRVRVWERPGRLRIAGDVGNHDACRRALKKWLIARGRFHLIPWLDRLSEATGLCYQRAQVRAQRTRWGSCSAHGTISINASLMFLESPLVDYLMVHELCHTRHLNHSRRYWDLVARHQPDYRELDRRLGEAWSEIPAWVIA